MNPKSSKTIRALLITTLALTAVTALFACRKETLGDKIDDATNSRPAEQLQDKAEDVRDAIKK